MKRTILIFLSLFILTAIVDARQTTQTSTPAPTPAPTQTTAKDTSKWKTGGFGALNFNQVDYSNWAKGGESSISGAAVLNLFANYAEADLVWDNTCDLGYGLMKQDGFEKRKTEDKIDISSKLGYKAANVFYYTVFMSFKSQFYEGYNYPNDSLIISTFFSPAYLVASLGMDWKPSDIFSLYISPCTGRFIFVSSMTIADMGAYTGIAAKYDNNGNLIEHGRTFKPEFGAYLNAKFKTDIVHNVNLESKIALFNNYTDKTVANRGNISVDWTNNIIFRINSFLSANLFVQTIYDHDTKVPIYQTINGLKTQTGTGPRLQVKEVFGLGLYYKF